MSTNQIQFWNGNKTPIRQQHELALLALVLEAADNGSSKSVILEDCTNYPSAKDEGDIFKKGADVCVTVAGNTKFNDGDYIPVYRPLAKGLLGYRLLIIREQDAEEFSQINTIQSLRQKVAGVPATWADANLLRENGCRVFEKGDLTDLIKSLHRKECDYFALGVNETQPIFDALGELAKGLKIESNIYLHYPFALVFYVHPEQQNLANKLELGLQTLEGSEAEKSLFMQFYGGYLQQANLHSRLKIQLTNNLLPQSLLNAMPAL